MSAFGSKLRRLSTGYGFWCPGCDMAHGVRVNSGTGDDWTFNNNGDSPTFSPSVLVTWTHGDPPVTSENFEEWKRNPWPQTKVNKVCHSFVRDGMIQYLTDCTHALAGQTIPLPDYPTRED